MGLFSNNNGLSGLQSLIQQLQNQNGGQSQGFLAPQITPVSAHAGAVGGGMGQPAMPQSATSTPQGGGMFSNLANNPALMQMLKASQGQGAQGAAQGAGVSQNVINPASGWNAPGTSGANLPSQLPWLNQPQASLPWQNGAAASAPQLQGNVLGGFGGSGAAQGAGQGLYNSVLGNSAASAPMFGGATGATGFTGFGADAAAPIAADTALDTTAATAPDWASLFATAFL